MATNNNPGKIVNVPLAANARASNTFQIQNRSNGTHNQLVVIVPMLTFPTPWFVNDHWIKRARVRVINKINSPRSRLFCRNWPRPGMIKEKNKLWEEFVETGNVFSVVVMKNYLDGKIVCTMTRTAQRWSKLNDWNTLRFLTIDCLELSIVDLLWQTLKDQFTIL